LNKQRRGDVPSIIEGDVPSIIEGAYFKKQKNRVFLIANSRALLMNNTALSILEQCDGKNTVEQIIDNLGSKYRVGDKGTFEDEVLQFIEDLVKDGVLKITKMV
jgi:hypothetical protein